MGARRQRLVGHAALAGALALALSALCAAPAIAESCGGTGGTRTQVFSCGPDEFITAVSAQGGDFVHRIRVECSRFAADGSVARGETSDFLGGPKARPGVRNPTYGHAECVEGSAVTSIDANCGAYVDRLTTITCLPYHPARTDRAERAATSSTGRIRKRSGTRAVPSRFGPSGDTYDSLNVGGPGGIRGGPDCPPGQAAWRIRVTSGSWMDRITLDCRAAP